MKHKNLFIALLLVICFTVGSTFNAFANIAIKQEPINSYDLEKNYATEYLELNGFGTNVLSNPSEFYATDGSIGAVSFDLNSTGYIIVNTNNLDIMEYSFDSKKPFDNYTNIIYNGPLQYYTENDGNMIDLLSNSIIDPNGISTNYISNKISVEDKNKKVENLNAINLSGIEDRSIISDDAIINNAMASSSFYETGSLSNSLVTWSGNYYCQPDSAAILLRYLYDYKNSSFLPSGYTTNGNVQGYLTNTYIYNGGTNSLNVVNGGIAYQVYDGSTLVTKYTKGMKQYLIDRGLSSSYSVGYSMYNFNTIKSIINKNFPVSVGTAKDVPGHTWDESHQVVAHGYMVGYDGVPFLYVNDTFGSNNIAINASSTYYPNYDMWYIN